jgi:hypothetical protein
VNLKMYGLSFVILGVLLLACSSPTSTTVPTQTQVPLPDPSLQTGSLSGGDQKIGSSSQGQQGPPATPPVPPHLQNRQGQQSPPATPPGATASAEPPGWSAGPACDGDAPGATASAEPPGSAGPTSDACRREEY